MRQRIRDFLHERAIKAQTKAFAAANTPGDRTREWEKLRTLLLHRSPQQVARMERAQFERLDPHAQQTFLDAGGVLPKTAIKRGVMRLFFRRLIPAPIVALVFRMFGLRGA